MTPRCDVARRDIAWCDAMLCRSIMRAPWMSALVLPRFLFFLGLK